jgi:iron complex transport system substrate-binding protein
VASLQKRITDVKMKVAVSSMMPKVFFELDPKLFTVGPHTLADEMISTAGGFNIANDAANEWPQLSQEVLVLKNPDVVLLTDAEFGETPDKVKARPGWDSLNAVKNNRLIPMDGDYTSRPGPRFVDGIELMAKAIHPELFK